LVYLFFLTIDGYERRSAEHCRSGHATPTLRSRNEAILLPRPQRGGYRRGPRRFGRGGRRRRKVCEFCSTKKRKALVIDYKYVDTLKRFLDERSRIQKARKTGTCRKHQRKLGRAIKRSREVALLPYSDD